jgi:hypothetical protein
MRLAVSNRHRLHIGMGFTTEFQQLKRRIGRQLLMLPVYGVESHSMAVTHECASIYLTDHVRRHAVSDD